MRQLLLFCLLSSALYLIAGRFARQETGGFTLAAVKADSYCTDACAPVPEGLFSTRYSYLGSGGQCFAFLSEDGKSVLKLLRNYTQLPRTLLSQIGLMAPRSSRQQQKLARDLLSYRLAAKELREQSALLYLHLSATRQQLPTVTLVDKLGIEHRLPLDDVGFLLQRRAEPLYPYINALMEKGERRKAEQALLSLVQLLADRIERGIYDEDAKLHRNCGFVEGQAVYIDLGRFCRSAKRERLGEVTARLKEWLHADHPQLEGVLLDAIERR